ncbi:MAG TPA: hypothetical protein VM327_07500 [Candidatus Thermoplasmatota archaeon]|nr:hypothetical protein [Candidatus Thermoplasmatota archaeon]
MRARLASALLLLSLVPLAGCFTDDDSPVGPDGRDSHGNLVFRDDWAEHALPYSDHDHHNPLQHAGLSTPNFQELGWDPLLSDYYGRSAGGYLCGDSVDTGERRLAAVHGYQTDVAFELVDVTDGAHPALLGEFVLPRSASRDVAITPDGNHIAIAVSTPDSGPRPAAASASASAVSGVPTVSGDAGVGDRELDQPYFRSYCDGAVHPVSWKAGVHETVQAALSGPETQAPFPPGVMLVSIVDPKNIEVEGYYSLPVLGAHSIYAGDLDGQTIVIASVVNLAAQVSNFWFFEVTEGPVPLRLLSLFQDRPDGGGAALINGHNDGVVQVHPVTGQKLAYLANWHQGMIILDMANPMAPVVLGRWSDNAGLTNTDLVQDGTGDVHEAIPLDTTWNGRHYTFIGQEILDHPSNTPSGLVHIVETTDPSHPVEVATWTLPVDVVWDEAGVFSTHYLSFWKTTLFVAHYHAGVWAIDLSGLADGEIDDADKHPPAVGVYIPANVSPQPPPKGPDDWTPTIMDTNVLHDGDMVVWDNKSGIYVVKFDDTQKAPPRVFSGYDPLT